MSETAAGTPYAKRPIAIACLSRISRPHSLTAAPRAINFPFSKIALGRTRGSSSLSKAPTPPGKAPIRKTPEFKTGAAGFHIKRTPRSARRIRGLSHFTFLRRALRELRTTVARNCETGANFREFKDSIWKFLPRQGTEKAPSSEGKDKYSYEIFSPFFPTLAALASLREYAGSVAVCRAGELRCEMSVSILVAALPHYSSF